MRAYLAERAPGLSENEARAARARRRRQARPGGAAARSRTRASRRDELLRLARATYRRRRTLEPAEAADVAARGRPRARCGREGARPRRSSRGSISRRARRSSACAASQRGAERDELLASLEELASWYRDLVVVAAGAEQAVVHADRIAELREDATRERAIDAEAAAEIARGVWRELEEFNLNPSLALEALFVRLQRAFSGVVGLTRTFEAV